MEPAPSRSVSLDQLIQASATVGIDEAKARELYARLPETDVPDASSPAPTDSAAAATAHPRFEQQDLGGRLISVLVAIGSLLVIGAYGWWATSWLNDIGPGAMLALTVVIQGGFLAAAFACQRRGAHELASWFAAIVSFMVPALVYAWLRTMGFDFANDYEQFFPLIDGEWVVMEIAALVAGAALLWKFRYPFVMVPLLLYAYFYLLDVTARLASDGTSDDMLGKLIVGYGLLGLAIGIALDLKGHRRFALWPHLFGAIPALTVLEVFFGVDWNVATILSGAALVLLGAWLGRVSLLAIGGIALWIAVTSIAANPLTLILSGLGAIAIAVWLARPGNPVRTWLAGRSAQLERE